MLTNLDNIGQFPGMFQQIILSRFKSCKFIFYKFKNKHTQNSILIQNVFKTSKLVHFIIKFTLTDSI